MKSFAKFNLNENFKNFIGAGSNEERRKWSAKVWALLQQTYAKIGGIKGSGFESEESMINKIPFWKIFTRGDKVLATFLYKDKSGRKLVALATDGSREAKAILIDMFENNMKVSWGEKSKGVLVFFMANVDFEVAKLFLIKPDDVKKLVDDEILDVTPERLEGLSNTDKTVYKKYNEVLKDYFYIREIGGEYFLKVAFGTPNKTIK